MSLYADSRYPVRSDLEAVHTKQLDQLGDPGTWGNSEQRLAVAGEIRRACVEAGVQKEPEEPQPETKGGSAPGGPRADPRIGG